MGRSPRPHLQFEMSKEYTDSPTLTLQLFGGPILTATMNEAPSLSPMSLILLSILALEGGEGISRELVRNRLWSRGTDSQLSQRLSQLIYMTRSRLGANAAALVGGDPLRFDSRLMGSDLSQVKQLLQTENPALAWDIVQKGVLSRTSTAHEELRDLYQNTIGDDLVTSIRECCYSVLNKDQSRKDWGAQHLAAKTLIDMDGPSLYAIRHMMIGQAMQGNYNAASWIYYQHKEYIMGLSDADEDKKSLEYIKTLVNRRIPLIGLKNASFPDETGRSEPPFAGRTVELGHLRKAVLNPTAFKPKLVIVSGPLGIGKTRLCHELACQLPVEGGRILKGFCHEAQQHLPISPLLDAFDDRWAQVHLDDLPEPWRTRVQWITDGFSDTKSVDRRTDRGQSSNPRVLFECLRQLLASLCRSGRILIWLDGAEFVDTTTAQAITSLLGHAFEAPLCFLLSVRTPIGGVKQLDPGLPISWLSQQTLPEELYLEGLSETMAVDLVKGILQEGDFLSEFHEVVSVAGTNPLLLVETATHWEKIREPALQAGVPLPPVFHKIFSKRLAELKPLEQQLLEIICSAGEPVSLEVLRTVRAFHEDTFRSALECLWENGLATVTPNAASPRSELVRRIVMDGLSAAGRAHVQTDLALALESHGSTPAATLARHFAEAGLNEKASAYGLQAAQFAKQNGAFDEAAASLELALGRATETSARNEITTNLGVLLQQCRRMEPAVPLLLSAERAHRETGDLALALDCKLRRLEAETILEQPSPEKAHARLLNVFRDAAANSWFDVAARALYYDIRYQRAWGRLIHARDVIDKAKSLLNDPLPDPAKVQVTSLLSLSAYFGDVDDGLRYAELSATLAHKASRPEIHIDALSRKVAVLIARGELNSRGGAQALQECEAVARNSPDPLRRLHPLINRCTWLSDIGEADAALTGFAAIESIVDQLDTPDSLSIYWCNRGIAAVRSKDFGSALSYFNRCEAYLNGQVHREIQSQVAAGRGMCAMESGDMSLAANYYDLIEIPPDWYFDPTLILGFRMLLEARRGRFREALIACAGELPRIRARFPVYWVDLLARHSELARRKAPDHIRRRELEEALAKVESLSLQRQSRRLQLILQEI